MEWNYKKTIIKVNNDGMFHFSINGNVNVESSLELAKSKIDEILKDYYTFNDEDIKKLYKNWVKEKLNLLEL